MLLHMKRTTIFLSEEVHDQLRGEAFRARISMAELIRRRLQPAAAPRPARPAVDPLMKVAGICRGPVLSANIDQELYG